MWVLSSDINLAMKRELVEDARRILESTSVGFKTWEQGGEPVLTARREETRATPTASKGGSYEVIPL